MSVRVRVLIGPQSGRVLTLSDQEAHAALSTGRVVLETDPPAAAGFDPNTREQSPAQRDVARENSARASATSQAQRSQEPPETDSGQPETNQPDSEPQSGQQSPESTSVGKDAGKK